MNTCLNNFFDKNMRLGTMTPLTLGLIYKNTPSWAEWSTVVYGIFMLLLVLIPNDLISRLCYVFIGGLMLTVGIIFKIKCKKIRLQNFEFKE